MLGKRNVEIPFYPLGKRAGAKPMRFPDASATPANMFYPADSTAYDMLARFIEHEYADPRLRSS